MAKLNMFNVYAGKHVKAQHALTLAANLYAGRHVKANLC